MTGKNARPARPQPARTAATPGGIVSPFQTLLVLIFWVAAWIAAEIIGERKGRRWTGTLLGFLLGWIGVIIIAVMPPTHEKLVQRERERLEIEREARGAAQGS